MELEELGSLTSDCYKVTVIKTQYDTGTKEKYRPMEQEAQR